MLESNKNTVRRVSVAIWLIGVSSTDKPLFICPCIIFLNYTTFHFSMFGNFDNAKKAPIFEGFFCWKITQVTAKPPIISHKN